MFLDKVGDGSMILNLLIIHNYFFTLVRTLIPGLNELNPRFHLKDEGTCTCLGTGCLI